MIEGAELNIYSIDGHQFNIDLSPMQLTAICKILGLQIEKNNLSYFSDESLKIIMEKTINRLKREEH